jgi:hypothetical protein
MPSRPATVPPIIIGALSLVLAGFIVSGIVPLVSGGKPASGTVRVVVLVLSVPPMTVTTPPGDFGTVVVVVVPVAVSIVVFVGIIIVVGVRVVGSITVVFVCVSTTWMVGVVVVGVVSTVSIVGVPVVGVVVVGVVVSTVGVVVSTVGGVVSTVVGGGGHGLVVYFGKQVD